MTEWPALYAMIVDAVRWADHSVLAYFLVLNSFYALQLLLSIPQLWSHWHLAEDEALSRVLSSGALPGLSILVPAYNEERTIVDSTLSFLTLEYARHEVIVVNDGSRDGTLERLIEAYELFRIPAAFMVTIRTQRVRAYYRSRKYSRLIVIDKENGGKADALNAALNAASNPYVVAVDADTLIEPDALLRLARPFLFGTRIAAVGGTVRVANSCTIAHGRVTEARVDRRWLPGIQVVEYLRAFLFGRLGSNRLGGNLIISGAFGLFRRDYLLAIRGWAAGTVGEDMELVVRLQRYLRERRLPDVVAFIPDPVAWTEAPTSLRLLGSQRERWHRGLLQTLWAHKRLLFNPRYGALGFVAYPLFLFGEALAPLVELFGYVGLAFGLAVGAVDLRFTWLFFCVAVLYGVLLSTWAILLEEVTFRRYHRAADVARLLFYAFAEALGYRQLTVWYRLKAFWKVLRGDKRWGDMKREGFATGAAPPVVAPPGALRSSLERPAVKETAGELPLERRP
jgi:cellulose synthase/poly-beta-1,6-N-acetylglucosamine synthase-like glycosyltransferase